jgi:hypothetical protein
MQIKKVSDTITDIEGKSKVRVEQGHVRRKAVATEELLSNEVTASHYHAPIEETVNGEQKVRYAIDSFGKRIELGKPMDYVDWLSDARVYYLYIWKDNRWQLHGEPFEAEDAAMSAAVTLAAK